MIKNNNNYELVYTTGEPEDFVPSPEEIRAQREAQYTDMIEWCVHHGIEDGHFEADSLVAQLLRELGYGKVADAFEALPKWYA